jgi:hypothetical protein
MLRQLGKHLMQSANDSHVGAVDFAVLETRLERRIVGGFLFGRAVSQAALLEGAIDRPGIAGSWGHSADV